MSLYKCSTCNELVNQLYMFNKLGSFCTKDCQEAFRVKNMLKSKPQKIKDIEQKIDMLKLELKEAKKQLEDLCDHEWVMCLSFGDKMCKKCDARIADDGGPSYM